MILMSDACDKKICGNTTYIDVMPPDTDFVTNFHFGLQDIDSNEFNWGLLKTIFSISWI